GRDQRVPVGDYRCPSAPRSHFEHLQSNQRPNARHRRRCRRTHRGPRVFPYQDRTCSKPERLSLMRCCYVSMIGKDDKEHGFTCQAGSLFVAANEAIREWATLWWYDPNTVITVCAGHDRWQVSQHALRAWKEGNKASRREQHF